MPETDQHVLVQLGGGLGNVILGTPLLVALRELGRTADVWLAADYRQTSELFRSWDVVRHVFANLSIPASFSDYEYVIPAIPPFYWLRFARSFHAVPNLVRRPADALFYQDEQEFYLSFARTLGYPTARCPQISLPISPVDEYGITSTTVVIAPGCKTGEMAAKRWPHFVELAEAFADVAVVGTHDDLRTYSGRPLRFPSHARSFVDQLTLRQTAELMAAAGVVVANDSGLAYVAAAVGTSAIILFGPTPDRTLGRLPPNVTVLRHGLPCEPCWFGQRFKACAKKITCLDRLTVETVIEQIEHMGIKRLTNVSPTSEPNGTVIMSN